MSRINKYQSPPTFWLIRVVAIYPGHRDVQCEVKNIYVGAALSQYIYSVRDFSGVYAAVNVPDGAEANAPLFTTLL